MATMTVTSRADYARLMNCMEVWGGHCPRSDRLRRPGLDVCVWSDLRGRAEAGGGDLHLLSSCASGRITRMLLADICGFGSLFAEISNDLRDIMKRHLNSIQQTRAVQEMTRRLGVASQKGGFASTLISTYFAPTRSFTLCNAGHPPPLLYRAAESQWSILKQTHSAAASCKQPLGFMDPHEYQCFKTKLAVGDMVLSYSNAITECRGSDGRTIGVNGMLTRLQQLDSAASENLGATLVDRLRREHDENLHSEDATVLVCRATDTPVAWRDNLLAPLRLFRPPTDKMSFATGGASNADW